MLLSGKKLSKKIASRCDSSKNIDARKLCKKLDQVIPAIGSNFTDTLLNALFHNFFLSFFVFSSIVESKLLAIMRFALCMVSRDMLMFVSAMIFKVISRALICVLVFFQHRFYLCCFWTLEAV